MLFDKILSVNGTRAEASVVEQGLLAGKTRVTLTLLRPAQTEELRATCTQLLQELNAWDAPVAPTGGAQACEPTNTFHV